MFVTLNHRTTIYLKQFTAGLLLVWFASIWVVQGFHHHTETASAGDRLQTGKACITAAASCAICDYHFAKDADAVTAFVIAPGCCVWPMVYAATEWAGCLRTVPGAADRGPPAIR